jgi:hypothetical protein
LKEVYQRHVKFGVPLRIPKPIAECVKSGVAVGLVEHHSNVYHHFRVHLAAEERPSCFLLRLRAEPTTRLSDLAFKQGAEFLSCYGEWRYSLLGDVVDAVDSVLLSPIVAKSYRYNLEDRLVPRAARDLFDLSVTAERRIPLDAIREYPVSAFFRGLPRIPSIGSIDVELHY